DGGLRAARRRRAARPARPDGRQRRAGAGSGGRGARPDVGGAAAATSAAGREPLRPMKLEGRFLTIAGGVAVASAIGLVVAALSRSKRAEEPETPTQRGGAIHSAEADPVVHRRRGSGGGSLVAMPSEDKEVARANLHSLLRRLQSATTTLA